MQLPLISSPSRLTVMLEVNLPSNEELCIRNHGTVNPKQSTFSSKGVVTLLFYVTKGADFAKPEKLQRQL